MSFILSRGPGDDQYVQINNVGWRVLLQLASSSGWHPQGTTAPDEIAPEDWSGEYASNDGQVIRSEDAAGLAEALTRAKELFTCDENDWMPEEQARQQQEILDAIREEDRELAKAILSHGIDEFIEFFKGGGAAIY